jgi:hypothetical protein
MDAERITKLVLWTHKNFVPAMKTQNAFVLGREARRMALQLPQNAPERMQAGWLFEDMRLNGEVVRCLSN